MNTGYLSLVDDVEGACGVIAVHDLLSSLELLHSDSRAYLLDDVLGV